MEIQTFSQPSKVSQICLWFLKPDRENQIRCGILSDARNRFHAQVMSYKCKYLSFGERSGFAYLYTWFFSTVSTYLAITL